MRRPYAPPSMEPEHARPETLEAALDELQAMYRSLKRRAQAKSKELLHALLTRAPPRHAERLRNAKVVEERNAIYITDVHPDAKEYVEAEARRLFGAYKKNVTEERARIQASWNQCYGALVRKTALVAEVPLSSETAYVTLIVGGKAYHARTRRDRPEPVLIPCEEHEPTGQHDREAAISRGWRFAAYRNPSTRLDPAHVLSHVLEREFEQMELLAAWERQEPRYLN